MHNLINKSCPNQHQVQNKKRFVRWSHRPVDIPLYAGWTCLTENTWSTFTEVEMYLWVDDLQEYMIKKYQPFGFIFFNCTNIWTIFEASRLCSVDTSSLILWGCAPWQWLNIIFSLFCKIMLGGNKNAGCLLLHVKFHVCNSATQLWCWPLGGTRTSNIRQP